MSVDREAEVPDLVSLRNRNILAELLLVQVTQGLLLL